MATVHIFDLYIRQILRKQNAKYVPKYYFTQKIQHNINITNRYCMWNCKLMQHNYSPYSYYPAVLTTFVSVKLILIFLFASCLYFT
jgi:hypothetical protein